MDVEHREKGDDLVKLAFGEARVGDALDAGDPAVGRSENGCRRRVRRACWDAEEEQGQHAQCGCGRGIAGPAKDERHGQQHDRRQDERPGFLREGHLLLGRLRRLEAAL